MHTMLTCKQILEDSSSNDNIAVTTTSATLPSLSALTGRNMDTMSTRVIFVTHALVQSTSTWHQPHSHLCQLFHLSINGEIV